MADFESCISQAVTCHHSVVQALVAENKALKHQLEWQRPCASVVQGTQPERSLPAKNCDSSRLSPDDQGGFPQKANDISIEMLEDIIPNEGLQPFHVSDLLKPKELQKESEELLEYRPLKDNHTFDVNECGVEKTETLEARSSGKVVDRLGTGEASVTFASEFEFRTFGCDSGEARRDTASSGIDHHTSEFDGFNGDLDRLADTMTLVAKQMEDNLKITKAVHNKVKTKSHVQPHFMRSSADRETQLKPSLKSQKSGFSIVDRSQALLQHSHRVARRNPLRQTMWRFVEDKESGRFARFFVIFRRYFDIFAFFFALAQITIPPEQQPLSFLRRGQVSTECCEVAIEVVFIFIFTFRLIVCPRKCLFWLDAYNIIDLVACLPLGIRIVFLLLENTEQDVSDSLGFMIFLCVVPALRLLKWLRCFDTFQLLLNAFMEAVEMLPVLIFTMVFMVMCFAVVIYYFEPRESVPTYPDSLYFVIVTLSTVGYGDITPESTGGRVITCMLIVVGPLYMAIPFGIVGSSFRQAWEDRHRWLFLSQLRTRVVHAGYQPQDIEEIFKLLDKEQRGHLTLEEFRSIIQVLEIETSEQCVATVFDMLDNDAGGSIDFQELLRGIFPEAYLYVFSRPSALNGRHDDDDGSTMSESRDFTMVGTVDAFHS